tara:strand:+ start:762 stop:1442 length:681 start_codon:yes stop_codon:yes gene_type:complete
MKHAHFPHVGGDISSIIETLVDVDGTAAHSHVQMLLAAANDHGAHPLAALADAAHYLCLLHGRFPGVIDHAAMRSADNAARHWLLQACEAFADERAFLTRVTVALGPVPSTAGQNNSDSSVLQQRHALEMLAQSDRRGCAMGAALTLVLDWAGIRQLLDRAALRVGLEPAKCGLPPMADTLAVARAIAVDDATIRAMQFGARQLLSQHRGLWEMMRARADIRASDR